MNIWIDSESLKPGRDDLLRPGCLFGLRKLREWNQQIGFEEESLSDRQRELLENEEIRPDFTDASEAEATITPKPDDRSVLQLSRSGSVEIESGRWGELAERICLPDRTAALDRESAETAISARISLDGTGKANIDTGIGFFDHMLEQLCTHGLLDLELTCEGDLEVDEHHTIEDTAIVLGQVIDKALGDKRGIDRYGFVLPMDESQARIALDLSGRPYLEFHGSFSREKVGGFPTEMTEHFFYTLAVNMKATLHMQVEGTNDHHKVEACFKGFARCLREAVSRTKENIHLLPSTKNLL